MELSKIKYQNIILTSKTNITNIVYEEENRIEETCDVGILFVGFSMLTSRADKAIALYKEGLLKRILISGGIGFLNTDRSIPEAAKIEEYLLANGISKKDILLEQNSRNTYENILFSLQLLKENYDLNRLRLALISSDYHVRRCQETMRKQSENKITLYGVGAKNGRTDKENWMHSLVGRKNVYQEAFLLLYYAKQKRMCDIDIPTLKRNFHPKEK